MTAVLSLSVLAIYVIYDFLLWWDPDFWAADEGWTLNVITVALVFAPAIAAGMMVIANPQAEHPEKRRSHLD